MAQIVGYRKDRLGARIIALGNLLRLEDRFGVSVKYLWPDSFEGYDMSIESDTHPIFEAGFQARYLRQIPEGKRAGIADLTDIDRIRLRIGTQDFAARLEKGERFLCNEGIHPAVFTDELGPEHLSAFRDALARIVWSPRVQEVLEQASAKLAALPKNPLALHVRRGDVLDKAPWCHKNWTSKFAPDEFYYTVMDQPGAATVLFSDTPEIVARMAAPRPNALTLNDLVVAPDLSEMQRDLIELLLMSQCAEIVAPSLSAFSSSAALIGGMRVTELPHDLPEAGRFAAYEILLERVLAGPQSFHNDGDFAQSLGYAFRHALNVKRHHELYAALRQAIDSGQKYAFFRPLAMALAIACGQPEYARHLGATAEDDPNLWRDDLLTCLALDCVAGHTAGDAVQATSDFLRLYFSRHKADHDQDALAHYFFEREPMVRELFLVDDTVLKVMSYGREKNRIFLFPVDDTIYDGALNSALPFWITGGDWPEMFEKSRITKNLAKSPDFGSKKASIPPEIREAEERFFLDNGALPEDPESLALLSVYSMALMLAGRYRRATALMRHCCKQMPHHPLFLKRLANRFSEAGQTNRAIHNLERAAEALPKHPGIALARAQIAQARNEHHTAAALFESVSDQALLPFTLFKAWETSLRKLNARDEQKSVISETARRFPGHSIFGNQWANKL